MAQADTVRSERINLRLSETAKRCIERAASVEGKTAEKSLRRHETIALAREDAARFIDALSEPPPPNDCLRAALEEHARRVDSR